MRTLSQHPFRFFGWVFAVFLGFSLLPLLGVPFAVQAMAVTAMSIAIVAWQIVVKGTGLVPMSAPLLDPQLAFNAPAARQSLRRASVKMAFVIFLLAALSPTAHLLGQPDTGLSASFAFTSVLTWAFLLLAFGFVFFRQAGLFILTWERSIPATLEHSTDALDGWLFHHLGHCDRLLKEDHLFFHIDLPDAGEDGSYLPYLVFPATPMRRWERPVLTQEAREELLVYLTENGNPFRLFPHRKINRIRVALHPLSAHEKLRKLAAYGELKDKTDVFRQTAQNA